MIYVPIVQKLADRSEKPGEGFVLCSCAGLVTYSRNNDEQNS